MSARVLRSPSTALLLAAAVIAPIAVQAQSDGANGEVEYYEPPVVKDAAGDVLSRPEFRNLPRLDLGPGGKTKELTPKSQEPDDEVRQVQRPRATGPLAELIASLFGGAVSMAVVLVMVVILGGIVALIALGLRRWERTTTQAARQSDGGTDDEETTPALMPGDRPADAWLTAARAAASAGRFDEALACLLLGAMGHTERAGWIRPRRGLTYRDYLRALPESSAWSVALDRLIRAYAPVGFGRRAATSEAFEAAVIPYETALAAEPTARAVSD